MSALRNVTAAETAGTAARERSLVTPGGADTVNETDAFCNEGHEHRGGRALLYIPFLVSVRDESEVTGKMSMACLGHWDCPLSGLCQLLKALLTELPQL